MRKAAAFYIQAATAAGFTLSPHFGPVRTSPTPAGKRAKKRAAKANGDTPQVVRGGGETKTIAIGDAGTVTIKVDVKWLDLDDATFAALRKAIRDLESLGVGS